MRSPSLNHAYKLVWSQVLNAWVVVSEIAKSRGKSKSQKAVALVSSAVFATATWAGPEGGVVTDGSGTIHYNGATTTINQASQTLNLNWNTFNVASHETVNFVQPSATALAVNQILDTNGSRILGNINANGQVWLINPNGIYFGAGAQVNVGSLLASTLNPLTNANGTQVFGNGGTGSIINHGNINATHGYVAFVANTVSNAGNITANGGTVALGAGSQVSLKFADNQLLSLTVDQSTLNNLAENKGLIQANGGAVLLSAGARDSLLASVVNNEGVIEAKTVDHKEGKIILLGGMAAGTTNVAGTLDASAQTGNGGFIETSAFNVKIADSAIITTKANNIDNGTGKSGTWLIDPLDFTIAASGGNVTGTAISTALQINNVRIQTGNNTTNCINVICTTGGQGNGDIHVNDTITWSSDKTLTLSAFNAIYVNKEITATNPFAKLVFETSQGQLMSDISSPGPNLAYAATDMNYVIRAKINLRENAEFISKYASDGANVSYRVISSLAGLDNIRGNLVFNFNYVLGADIDAIGSANFEPIGHSGSPFKARFDGFGHVISNLTINRNTTDDVGLFGAIDNAHIRNLGLVGGTITGKDNVGSLVGNIVGANRSFINKVYSTATVSGNDNVGGLIGRSSSMITQGMYATGAVSGHNAVGGLIGRYDAPGSSLQDVYSTGAVTGNDYVGGLIGYLNGGLLRTFSTGLVTANTANTGGLVGGIFNGSISSSLWDITASGKSTNPGTGAVGKTTAELKTLSTYTASFFDISGSNGAYPTLNFTSVGTKWLMTPPPVSATPAQSTSTQSTSTPTQSTSTPTQSTSTPTQSTSTTSAVSSVQQQSNNSTNNNNTNYGPNTNTGTPKGSYSVSGEGVNTKEQE